MTDRAKLEEALIRAHNAGDGEAAQFFADEIKRGAKGVSPQAADMAAKGLGVIDAMFVSAGRGLDKIGAGLQQGLHSLRLSPENPLKQLADPRMFEESRQALKRLKTDQAEKDVIHGGVQRERPVAAGVGESLPYLAVPGGLLGSSAIVGGLEAAKYGSPGERAGRGLLGFGSNMVGGAIGNAVGKAIAPVADDAVSATQKSAISTMDNLGMQPRLSQVTGSPFWARVEDWAARTPGGAGVMQSFYNANQRAANQAAARGIGESAEELSPQVLAAANQRMGRVFEAIKTLPGNPIKVDANVGNVADDILRQVKKMLPTQQDEALTKLAEQAKWVSQNRGRIDGESYQLIRSGLSEASFDASGTNRVLYGRLLDALDNSADASLRATGNAALADALKTVRPQYANLKMLEKGTVAEAGNVSPQRLASAMRTQNPAAFREGRMAGNPLYDLAQVGEAFKPLRAGSPTYERTLMSNPLSTTLGAMAAWPAAHLTTNPAALAYPRYIGNTAAAGLLAQGANPAVRAGTMGLLNNALSPMLLPVMAE